MRLVTVSPEMCLSKFAAFAKFSIIVADEIPPGINESMALVYARAQRVRSVVELYGDLREPLRAIIRRYGQNRRRVNRRE